MSKKTYVIQMFETTITEYAVQANDEEEAREKLENGEAEILNEYFLGGQDNWSELDKKKEEEKKKLH
tara:strand:- start:451 stop:651 length:201 start_codon:yes stop_codon:yes gene_type:complete